MAVAANDTVTVSAGQTIGGLDFGSFQTATTLRGTSFFDVNDNGLQDGGEAGRVGRTVYLDGNRNGSWILASKPRRLSALALRLT